MIPVALTIAGSDPSGGAGILADLKTFHQFGVYGEAVITLLTVQNTLRVDAIEIVAPDLVRRQIDVLLEDIPPQAVKTGALGSAAMIEAVAEAAARFSFPLVVDPVMISKRGAPLLPPDACDTLIRRLLPRAFLVTPNLHEASALAGFPVTNPDEMERAVRVIAQLGPRAVLLKGGHLAGDALDLLFYQGALARYSAPRVETPHTHGTGCTYSAAITASLARGLDLPAAVKVAKRFITRAIASAPGLGHGSGPVNHHAEVD